MPKVSFKLLLDVKMIFQIIEPDIEYSRVISMFGSLEHVYQRDMFFYLHEAKKKSDERMDWSDKRVNNVSNIEWIRVMLTICGAAKFCYGEIDCYGGSLKKERFQMFVYHRDKFVLIFFFLLFINF